LAQNSNATKIDKSLAMTRSGERPRTNEKGVPNEPGSPLQVLTLREPQINWYSSRQKIIQLPGADAFRFPRRAGRTSEDSGDFPPLPVNDAGQDQVQAAAGWAERSAWPCEITRRLGISRTSARRFLGHVSASRY